MGSWLALWLYRLGARVTGYALDPPTQPSHFVAAGIGELLAEDVRGDLRDADLVAQTVQRSKPEVVFHLAAQPLVLWGIEHPRETFEVNVIGTVNVCDAVRAAGHPCAVVVATSDKCYRNDGQGRAFTESDPLGGRDPYSASKAGAEMVVAAYRSSFFASSIASEHGIDLTSVRAGNVIGGGDWAADRLIPDAVRALSVGNDLVVRNPASTRPWQHVLEPLSGYLTVATRAAGGELRGQSEPTWNFGPDPSQVVTAADLATSVVRHWGSGRWKMAEDAPPSNEATVLHISIDKAAAELGWRPRWDFDRTVASTIEWYRGFYDNDHESMRDRSLADIAAYEATTLPAV
jgi:CDP-glucose 4,6-dehydratase